MQCVYILTNEHVPNLVKFGFSTRDPHDRAAELSAPTGVPGQWIVHHYWRVADGYATEQSVFHKFRELRLDRQEFLRFTAHEAVQAISQELQRLGNNPIEQARKRDVRKVQTRQEKDAQRLAERERLAALQKKLEVRRTLVLKQINEQYEPVQGKSDRLISLIYKVVLHKVVLLALLIMVFSFIFYINRDSGVINAGVMAIIFTPFLIYMTFMVLLGVLSSFSASEPKKDEKLLAIETEVLAQYGLKSLKDLDDARTLV